MGKLKYLSKNIALFSISNFVSKILVFLLVPFYTNVLTTYEYGIADVIQVTLLLLVPMVTLNIGEAALRFGVEEVNNRKSIYSVGIKYVLRASIIVAFICFAIRGILSVKEIADAFESGIAGTGINEIKWYLLLFAFLFAANALYEFLILYFQGAELVETIVIGSVSCTFLTICSNLIFLLGLKTGLNGYIYSQIIAFALASLIMILVGKKRINVTVNSDCTNKQNNSGKELVYNECNNSTDNSADNIEDINDIEKRMLDYSKPMIAYSTASWVNNAVDRYFVLYLCGAAINGIYGVAYKIPAILMVFQRIFAQAWQLSATKAHKDEDSEAFYSDMYKVYNSFMVIGCAALVLLVKPVAAFLFRKDFYEAWELVPPLLISVIFGALTGFLGSICLAHKDSKSMGKATSIGAIFNIVLNLFLIPYFQAMGAAIATGVSYFTMCMMAVYFVRKHVNLKVKFARNFVSYLILVIESAVMIFELPYHILICALLFIVIVLIYIKDFIEIINVLLKKIGINRSNERN